jgi:uncharacterized protein YktA (UPF0223 family)
MDINVKDVIKHIEEFIETGNKAKVLKVGYKTYATLMRSEKFADKMTKDEKDTLVRHYKGIKIKIVTEKHYLEIK